MFPLGLCDAGPLLVLLWEKKQEKMADRPEAANADVALALRWWYWRWDREGRRAKVEWEYQAAGVVRISIYLMYLRYWSNPLAELNKTTYY